ncbi:MAG: hypothetical protein EA381_03585 [Planctomycetaceae bacterium]|nr:MAG: hypothetical protein EA381_03585 [Planctomycetaceae bacterium]
MTPRLNRSPSPAFLTATVGLLLATLCGPLVAAEPLRIDQLRLIGTHNSYRLAADEVACGMIALANAAEAKALDYTHRPLREQLETLKMRHFELDLYRDPQGGLFANPLAYEVAKRRGTEVPPLDPQNRLQAPGIKVLHSPDFDFRTTVYTLRDALTELRLWSDANPKHVPIFILLELKSESFWPLTRPATWDETGFEELHRTILAVLPRERILTPDDLRGGQPTLREAVYGIGWPPVDSHRGKFVLLLDNEDATRDSYLAPSEILENQLLFVSVPPQHPAAAWMKRNDPIGAEHEIRALVADGFLVRTRADSGTTESRANDTRRRDRALASGAQLISTDYPEPDRRFSDYHVPALELPE